MKAQQTTGNMSKHIILLCALLFAGCMDGDLSTPDDDGCSHDSAKRRTDPRSVYGPHYGRRIYRYDHDQTFHNQVPNYGVHNNTTNRRVYRYDHDQTFHNQVPNYSVHNNTDSWQTINHNWSNGYVMHLQTASTTQTTGNKPDKMSLEDFEQGCAICLEENAYKDHKAIKCSHCDHYVCLPCYNKMDKASDTSIRHDYRAPMSTSYFTLKKQCPFCRSNF